jgi:hypothetical protein
MHCCQVDIPSRLARFQAFAANLPADVRGTVVCMHGTPKSENAFSIARTGPDLNIRTNGRAYGHGFYCADGIGTPRGYVLLGPLPPPRG